MNAEQSRYRGTRVDLSTPEKKLASARGLAAKYPQSQRASAPSVVQNQPTGATATMKKQELSPQEIAERAKDFQSAELARGRRRTLTECVTTVRSDAGLDNDFRRHDPSLVPTD